MSRVALMARFTAKDGKADELVAAFGAIQEQAETEPGTLLYSLNRSTDQPEVFWVCELYADRDAFRAHAGSEAMAAANAVLADLIADSELVIGEPVTAKGLPG